MRLKKYILPAARRNFFPQFDGWQPKQTWAHNGLGPTMLDYAHDQLCTMHSAHYALAKTMSMFNYYALAPQCILSHYASKLSMWHISQWYRTEPQYTFIRLTVTGTSIILSAPSLINFQYTNDHHRNTLQMFNQLTSLEMVYTFFCPEHRLWLPVTLTGWVLCSSNLYFVVIFLNLKPVKLCRKIFYLWNWVRYLSFYQCIMLLSYQF